VKVGGNSNFCEIGGKCSDTENRGKFKICSRRLKIILADENRKVFREKLKSGIFSTECQNFVGNRGKSETGWEMHHCLRGDGPL